MPRAERIWFPGAVYHIIQRGNNQEEIYREDRDYEWFLRTVREVKRDIAFNIYCYVLMSNHYHMTVKTFDVHISEIMKAINSKYAIRFNQKYERKGHLFQGRFKGILVVENSYLLELSRYIHLNPVKAGLAEKPEDYRWSSYHVYKNSDEDFLVDPDEVLTQLQSAYHDKHESYAQFIHEKLSQIKEEKDWLAANVKRQRFLGGKDFVQKVIKKHTLKKG